MARIPDSEIERRKQQVSLPPLVEAQGIELKRHGADLLGLCPSMTIAIAGLAVRQLRRTVTRRRSA